MVSGFELSPGKWVGEGHPVYIIAEIGQNHQGSVEIAKQLISKAKEIGVDCVKFQKSCLKAKFTAKALKRKYDGPTSWGATYGEHKEYLEFSSELGIAMTASAMDPVSADFLLDLGVPFIKIGSGDSNNPVLLEKVAQMKINLVVSTGMSDMDQVESMISCLNSNPNLVLLQCTSSYPTAPEDVNLQVIDTFKKKFKDVIIGYSGHELGYIPTLGAVSRGAKVVERHITLDKTMKGTDHACSLDIEEFRQMVSAIRTMEKALGSGEKKFLDSERSCFDKLGKTVVAACQLPKGHILEQKDIAVKVSSEKGISPMKISQIFGKSLINGISEDQPIKQEDLNSSS